MLEDRLLIWKFKKGDREALCRIYRKYGDALLALAGALLQDVSEAEDVVHDVFCKFIESRDTFKLDGSLKSFLSTCVVNLSRDKQRARKSKSRVQDETSVTSLETNGPEHHAIFGEQARDLNRAIAQLSYEQREIVMLHLQSGMTFRKIANVLGISINTTKSRYRYGLQNLRRRLSDKEKNHEIR